MKVAQLCPTLCNLMDYTVHGILQARILVAQLAKNPPAMQRTWVESLSWEDTLEEEMTTHSSFLAWEIPWTKEPRRLQSMGVTRVRHNLVTKPPPYHHIRQYMYT